MTDSFTVGRIVLRRRAFGLWSGQASIRNVRAWTLQRTRSRAELWANRLIRETGTRAWAGCNSRSLETMSLCDQEATR
jgi:hypothetical protein